MFSEDPNATTRKPVKKATFQTKMQNNSRKMSMEDTQVTFKVPQLKNEDASTTCGGEEENPGLTTMFFDTTANEDKIMLASDLASLQQKKFFGAVSTADHILMGIKNPRKGESLSGFIQQECPDIDFNVINNSVHHLITEEPQALGVKGIQYWRSGNTKKKFFQKKDQQVSQQNVYIPTKEHTFLAYIKMDLCFKFDSEKSCFTYQSQSGDKTFTLDKATSLQILEEIVRQQQQN